MFAPAVFALFLAQAAPAANDPATLNQAMIFIGGLTACAIIGNQVMGAMLNFRKLRGADPGDDRRYASRAEHEALRDQVVGLKSEMTSLSKTITNEFSSLNRSIGVLEGMLKSMSKPSKSD